MVIVDDHLTLLVLAGVVSVADLDDDIATTSLWYLRLLSAATAPPPDAQGPGRLARTLASLPDPKQRSPGFCTRHAPHSRCSTRWTSPWRHRAYSGSDASTLLAAETLGTAIHHEATMQVAAPKRWRAIEEAARAEGISYEARSS